MNLPLKIATFLALAAIVALAARSLLKERETQQITAKTYTVKTMDIEQSVYGSGALRCARRAEIASRVTGKILAEDMQAEEGQTVNAGDVLCTIRNEELESNLNDAKVKHKNAKARYDQALEDYKFKEKTHVELNTPSKKELERLQLDLADQEIELKGKKQAVDDLEKKVRDLIVRSPLAGTVLKCHLTPSELEIDPEKVFPEGTPLFEVGDLTSLRVYGTILESDRSKVQEGDPAMVLCGKKGWLSAKITRLDLIPSAASEGGRYEVELEFETSPSGVNEGLTVDFRIIVEKKENVLGVPVEYVEVEEGRHWVKRVEGQTVNRVPIEVGISSHSFYEVTSGLREGDTVQWDAGGEE